MKTCKSIRILSWLLLAFVSLSVNAQTQDEMNREACDKYRRDDAELNRVYQQILNEYKPDAVFIAKLRAAQRAWIAFRDAQMAALYPAADPRGAYGSVYLMCRCSALTEVTLSRTEELRRWVKGLEAGDVCAGSIKIRGYDGAIHRRLNRNPAARKGRAISHQRRPRVIVSRYITTRDSETEHSTSDSSVKVLRTVTVTAGMVTKTIVL